MLNLLLAGALLAVPASAEDSPWLTLSRHDHAGDLRQAGELRLLLGDLPGAEKDFTQALQKTPADFELLYGLARAKRERPEEALPVAARAASAVGASAVQRAKANLLAGELRSDIGDRAGAAKSLALALKDAPENLDVLYALVRLKRGDKPAALDYAERAERAAAASPRWLRPAALYLAGRAWLELDEPSRAAENFRLALQFNPENLDALGALVRIKGKLTSAQLDSVRRSALAAGPAKESVPTPDSEDAVSRALESNPNDLEALRRRVALLISLKRPADAVAAAKRFQAAVGLAPVWQQAEANRALAALWLELGDRDEAVLILNQTRDVRTDDIETWRMLATIPGHERLKPPASIDCTAAQMRLELGDLAGAEENVKRALKLEPHHSWARQLQSSLKEASRTSK